MNEDSGFYKMQQFAKGRGKGMLAHAGSAGGGAVATVIIVLQLLGPRLEAVEQRQLAAREKVDSAIVQQQADIGEIKGMMKTLLMIQGIATPKEDSSEADSNAVVHDSTGG